MESVISTCSVASEDILKATQLVQRGNVVGGNGGKF